ncbi:MAG TPA: hypothetical protein VHG51_02130, partial [Longimicrobiaceae bacterium]|nr:hypothetical protein [Longimicrobiaceae bacterium]
PPDGAPVEARRVVLVAPAATLGWALDRFARLLRLAPAVRARLEARIERRLGRPLADFSVPGMAPGLAAAALVVHDRGDREIPFDEGRAIAAGWPGAELVATTGLGHNRVLRAPEVVERAVLFLEPLLSAHAAAEPCAAGPA